MRSSSAPRSHRDLGQGTARGGSSTGRRVSWREYPTTSEHAGHDLRPRTPALREKQERHQTSGALALGGVVM